MKTNVDVTKIRELEEKIEEYSHFYELKIEESEIEHYVASLEHTEKSLRRGSLDEYIKAKLESEASDWKRRFEGYLNRLTQMKDNLLNSVTKLTKYISTKENTIADLKYKKSEKEAQAIKIEQDIINVGNSHHKITIIFLLIIALALTIVSGNEFYEVKKALAGYDSNEEISILSAIIYILGSFAFLAGGKILSIIYERSGRNNKFFYGVAISAVFVTLLGILSLATSTSMQDDVINLTKKIGSYTGDGEAGPDEANNEESDKESDENGLANLEKLQEEATKDLKSMRFYFIILTLLSELLIGAMAWITLIDYNHTSSKEQMEKTKSKLDAEILKIEEKINKEENNSDYQEYRDRLSVYNNYISEIEQIIAQYDTFDEHEVIRKSFNSNLQEGLKLLQKYNIQVG